MRYLSVCSGIEAASVAWEPLGWEPMLFSEIERFPRAVLKERQRARDVRHGIRPGMVPLWGDFTTIRPKGLRRLGIDTNIDVLVGGTPCQSFSVAGFRRGMDDPRGNLALAYLQLARRLRPTWLVWENVPGVLSSNGGRDFGAFLGGLAQLGYGFAYRVLDAQYFGVPQRRRRVFVVGHLGDWRRAAAVLFERHSLSGHPAPSREAGQAAPTLPSRSSAGGGLRTDFDCDGGLIHAPEVSPCLKARDYKGPSSDGDGDGAPLLAVGPLMGGGSPKGHGTAGINNQAVASGHIIPIAIQGGEQHGGKKQQGPGIDPDTGIMYTLSTREQHAVAFQDSQSETREADTFATLDANYGSRRRAGVVIGDPRRHDDRHRGWENPSEIHPTLPGGAPATIAFGGQMSTPQVDTELSQTLQAKNPQAIASPMAVRRITPTEAERLQAFPDGYTRIPTKRSKKPPSAAKLAKYPDLYELGEDGIWTTHAQDGPRYKALGNSMATSVVRWIGQRIQAVEKAYRNAERKGAA